MIVVAVGGHADDIELGVGATLNKHAQAGDTVHSIIVTHSGYSGYDGKVIRESEVALREAEEAGTILGISTVTCLGYETKEVVYGVQLIEDLNREFDTLKPDIIYTHWSGDCNQDHEAISKAVRIAARNYTNIAEFRSNNHISNIAWHPNLFIQVSVENLQKKILAVRAHASEYSRRNDNWTKYLINDAANSGMAIGVPFAEPLMTYKWLIK